MQRMLKVAGLRDITYMEIVLVKKNIGLLVLAVVLGFSSFAQAASTTFDSHSHLVDIELDNGLGFGFNNLPVDIDYDVSALGTIDSAYLSVLLSDDADWIPQPETADITTINGVPQGFGVIRQEIDSNLPTWYWEIDVKDYLITDAPGTLSFLLNAESGDFEFHLAQLTVGYTADAVSAVPVPAALFLFAPALLGFFGLRRKANA